MKTLKNMTGDSLEQMIDYKVVDQNGDSIGTLHSLWSDPATGAVEFLGVKTGWIFGSNHVVPAEKAELDETENVVRLPYTQTFIKEAPSISAEAEISEEEEENIYRYYGLNEATDAPGNNQAGVNYGAASGSLPEAIGGATVANASEAGMAGTQSGAPTGTNADLTQGSGSRLRRTSRPDASTASASIAGTAGSSGLDDIGPTDGSARASTSGTEPGSFATANMFGSTGSGTAPVAADSAGAFVLDPMSDVSDPLTNRPGSGATGRGDANVGSTRQGNPNTDVFTGTPRTDLDASEMGASSMDPSAGLSDSLAENFGRNVTDPGDENAGLTRTGGKNPDAITGEPGSHPVGTGVGALAAGATGLAIGAAVGGPIGAPLGAAIGAVVGAVGGGYAGKGVAEAVNPTDEDAYWQSNYHNAPYKEEGYEYSDYSPAYRTGYEGFARHASTGKDYNEVEGDLEQDYNRNRGESQLSWDKAKAATRDAWDRLKNRTSEANRD